MLIFHILLYWLDNINLQFRKAKSIGVKSHLLNIFDRLTQ